LAIAAVAWLYAVRVRPAMVDFAVYYRAGERVWRAQPLYQASDGHYMFKYLPASALIVSPISALPLEGAKAAWFVLTVAAAALSFKMARELARAPDRVYAWALPAAILAKYFLREFRLGQINVIVMAIMLGGIRAIATGERERRRDIVAGVLAGLAAALKPYAALLIAYFVVTRRWRVAAVAAATLAAAVAAPALLYGVSGNLELLASWIRSLSASTPGELTNNDNVSVLAMAMKWAPTRTYALMFTAALLAALACVLAAVIARGRQRRDAVVLEGAMVLTLIPLVSPMGWDYNFVLALLAVTLIVVEFPSFPRAGQWILAIDLAIIGVVVYDLVGRRAYAAFMQSSATTVNFLLVLLSLAYLRLRRAR